MSLLNSLDIDVEIVLTPKSDATAKHKATVRVRRLAVA
jgi:hypothetical protein